MGAKRRPIIGGVKRAANSFTTPHLRDHTQPHATQGDALVRKFLRRQLTYFLIGFLITFIIYLFVRFDPDQVILGVVISAVGGVAMAAVLFWLGRRFPDDDPVPTVISKKE